MEPGRVEHPLAPVFDGRSRALVLGTMPSPASRRAGFYYGHPQNRFWKVLGALFDEPEPSGASDRRAFLIAHRLALWDMLASCNIRGAADASIAEAVPNDLSVVAARAPLRAVFTTGAKAAALYRRFGAAQLAGVPFRPLPSTSAANARMGLQELVAAYQPLREALDEEPADG